MTNTCNGVIFDGDDTLWTTQPLYDRAKRMFFALLSSTLDIEQELAVSRLERIDLANLQTLGFSRSRFPTSLVRCYSELAEEAGRRVDLVTLQEVRAIGEGVFRDTIEPLTSAAAVLSSLSPFYRLFLLTKGDNDIQEARLTQSGLSSYFERVWIVPTKSEAEFALVAQSGNLEPANCWSVGNSLRSDINPALRIGMRAIWIPSETWAYERGEAELAPGDARTVRRLEEILEILL